MFNKIATLSINPIIKDKEPSIYIHKIKAFLDGKNIELSKDAEKMKKTANELDSQIQENRIKLLELETIHMILTDDLTDKIKRSSDTADISESLETVRNDIKGLKDLLRSQETTLSNTKKEWNNKKLNLISELDKIWESITVYIDIAKKDIDNINQKLKHGNDDEVDSEEVDSEEVDSDIESIGSDYDEENLKLITSDSSEVCPYCENLLCTCVD